MVNDLILWVTTISIILIVYHHVGYPLLLKFLAFKSQRRRCSSSKNKPSPDQSKRSCHSKNAHLPSIVVLMPVFNEARWIADKIRNLATLDYPSNKFRVILACDGCTDSTVEIARKTRKEYWFQDLSLSIIEYPKNEGKVATINKTMAFIADDLVALTDVSALISIDALSLASEHFKNANLGVINSHYTLLSPTLGEKKYWEYQCNIKKNEAIIGSTLGAHGALYLFRQKLFTPLAQDTINDDFILPMNIVAQGYHADVDQAIIAVEMEPTNASQDFHRRLRIGAGNYQQLLRLATLLHPKYGGTAFTFASGKALRVFIPLLMLTALTGCLYLSINHDIEINNGLFIALSAAQIAIYLTALFWFFSGFMPKHPLVQSIQYLVAGHIANGIGSLRYMFGLEKGVKK